MGAPRPQRAAPATTRLPTRPATLRRPEVGRRGRKNFAICSGALGGVIPLVRGVRLTTVLTAAPSLVSRSRSVAARRLEGGEVHGVMLGSGDPKKLSSEEPRNSRVNPKPRAARPRSRILHLPEASQRPNP